MDLPIVMIEIKISILVGIGIKSLCHIQMVFAFLARESIVFTHPSVCCLFTSPWRGIVSVSIPSGCYHINWLEIVSSPN